MSSQHKQYELTQDSHSFPSDSVHTQSYQLQTREQLDASPLSFYCRINGTYYISFKRQLLWRTLGLALAWTLLNWFLYSVVSSYNNIGDTVKYLVKIGFISQVVLFLIISFLDAGTLFEDEEDNSYKQERFYCSTCKLYRKKSSKHCIWCQKCTKWYDHHCSVFGKCIGKRNVVFFYLFILTVGSQMPTLVVLTVLNIASSAIQ